MRGLALDNTGGGAWWGLRQAVGRLACQRQWPSGAVVSAAVGAQDIAEGAGRRTSVIHKSGGSRSNAGPYPGDNYQPHGIEPAIHPNDRRQRCYRRDQNGQKQADYRAEVVLGSDPNPSCGV